MKPVAFFLTVLALFLSALTSNAAERRRSGDFDFYVLSLSWSPSWCAADPDRRKTRQCDPERDFGFIVHGLWPQYERGYPEFCATRQSDRVPEDLGRAYLDIIPSMGLIGHEWRKHGTCSGLDQPGYFAKLREAYEKVRIPPALKDLPKARSADPDLIEKAFLVANSNLKPQAVAVTCSRRMLEEVRICMSRDLEFRACPEIDRNACSVDDINIPAIP